MFLGYYRIIVLILLQFFSFSVNAHALGVWSAGAENSWGDMTRKAWIELLHGIDFYLEDDGQSDGNLKFNLYKDSSKKEKLGIIILHPSRQSSSHRIFEGTIVTINEQQINIGSVSLTKKGMEIIFIKKAVKNSISNQVNEYRVAEYYKKDPVGDLNREKMSELLEKKVEEQKERYKKREESRLKKEAKEWEQTRKNEEEKKEESELRKVFAYNLLLEANKAMLVFDDEKVFGIIQEIMSNYSSIYEGNKFFKIQVNLLIAFYYLEKFEHLQDIAYLIMVNFYAYELKSFFKYDISNPQFIEFCQYYSNTMQLEGFEEYYKNMEDCFNDSKKLLKEGIIGEPVLIIAPFISMSNRYSKEQMYGNLERNITALFTTLVKCYFDIEKFGYTGSRELSTYLRLLKEGIVFSDNIWHGKDLWGTLTEPRFSSSIFCNLEKRKFYEYYLTWLLAPLVKGVMPENIKSLPSDPILADMPADFLKHLDVSEYIFRI